MAATPSSTTAVAATTSSSSTTTTTDNTESISLHQIHSISPGSGSNEKLTSWLHFTDTSSPSALQWTVVGLSNGRLVFFKRTASTQAQPQPCTAGHHSGPVSALAYDEDLSLLFTGSHDGTVHIWHFPSNTLAQVLRPPHGGSVSSIVLHDGLVTIASRSAGLTVWYREIGRELLLYPRFTLAQQERDFNADSSITALAYCDVAILPATLLAGDEAGDLWFWQLKSRPVYKSAGRIAEAPYDKNPTHDIPPHMTPAKWAPATPLIVLKRRLVALHTLSIRSIVVVPTEKLLFTASYDGFVRATSFVAASVTLHQPTPAKVNAITWNSTTREVWMADTEGAVHAWSPFSERSIHTSELLSVPLLDAAILPSSSPPESILVTTSSSISTYSIARTPLSSLAEAHTGAIIALLLAEPRNKVPMGKHALPALLNKDTSRRTELVSTTQHTKFILYSASTDGTIRLWDPTDMTCSVILHIPETAGEVTSMVFAPTLNLLFSGHGTGLILVWNPATGGLVSVQAHNNTVTDLIIHDMKLISTSFDGRASIWDISRLPSKTVVPDYSLPADQDELLLTAFHAPSNTYLVTGNSCIISFYGKRGELLAKTAPMASPPTALIVDGHIAFIGHTDGSISAWDLIGHVFLTSWVATAAPDDAGPILALLLVPEHSLLCSSRQGGSVHVWDINAGLGNPPIHSYITAPTDGVDSVQSLTWCAISQDLIAGTASGALYRFPLEECEIEL